VAEDDDAMRSVIVDTLRRDGHLVIEASDGGKLLVLLAQQVVLGGDVIDLLVADIRMPVCTGLQIVEQLRCIQSPIRIILMTAFGDQGTRAHAESLGALLFDKPFAMSALRLAVDALLEEGRCERCK
jgi:DNA-binding response OmpR family regulator